MHKALPTTATAKAHSRHVRLVEALQAVFQKVVRILSGSQKLTLSFGILPKGHPMSGAPGWTDGENIFLNRDYIWRELGSNPSREDIGKLLLRLKGVIYHELSHILYTPRFNSVFVKWVTERNAASFDHTWWWSFNALEDQRIETLFTGTYRPSIKFFEAAALEWLVKDPEAAAVALPLLHGRKYMPADVRAKSEAAFRAKHGDAITDGFKEIIDQYLLITFPADDLLARDLVRRYRDHLEAIAPDTDNLPSQPSMDNNPTDGPDDGGGPGTWVIRRGDASIRKQKQAQDSAAEAEEQESEEDDGPEDQSGDGLKGQQKQKQEPTSGDSEDGGDKQDGDNADGADGAEGEGADGTESDTDEAGDSDGGGEGEGASQDDGNTDSDDEAPSKAAGAPGANTPSGSVDDLLNHAAEALAEALGDESLAEDVKSMIKSVIDTLDDQDGLGSMVSPWSGYTTDGETRRVQRRVVDQLSKLAMDLESERKTHQMQGRLNVRRVMSAQPHIVDVFDKWDEGAEEAGGIEAVLLLDMSTSMRGIMLSASKAMWAIKRAFDVLGIKTTVLGYSDEWTVLYRPGEKAEASTVRSYKVIGGTDARGALKTARRLLSEAKTANKVLVTITDGCWFSAPESDAIVAAINQIEGVTSLLIGLNQYPGRSVVESHGRHGHMVAKDVYNPMDIPPAIASLVKEIMRSVTVGHHLHEQ